MDAGDFESEGRVKRRVIGGAILLLLAGAVAAFFVVDKPEAPKRPKPRGEVIVTPLPPPPPPPPPLPPPPPPEPEEPQQQEMVEEASPEESPEPESPSPEEPPALGTGLTGDGPNTFGLGTKGDGGGGGRGPGVIGGGGTRFRAYGKSVEGTVLAALKRNPKLRKATLRGELLVWVDRGTGRTTRAKLIRANGSSELIEEARLSSLNLQIPGSAPSDMPLPVRLKINIRPPAN